MKKSRSKVTKRKWKLAGAKMRKTIVAGVPVVGGTVGVPYATCASHVKEVEDSMLYQGHIARSTDSLTLAASYLCNKLKTPMFKVHIKLTIVNNKPLCEYTPPLASFDKMLKDVLHSSVKIGSGIKPVNIDILQPQKSLKQNVMSEVIFISKTKVLLKCQKPTSRIEYARFVLCYEEIWYTSEVLSFAPNISSFFL